jgi:hypothetical protein
VADKNVPSADNQSLIPVTKAKYKNRSPIMFGQPKQKLKESAEAEFVPSPAIFAILVLAAVLFR